MYIDTHAHIISTFYDDPETQIKVLEKSQIIEAVINVATTIDEANEVLKLSKEHKGFLFPALGIHPEVAYEKSIEGLKEDLKKLETLIGKNDVIAIGEFGLDYKDNPSDEVKEKQFLLMKYQLALAIRHNKPIIIHSRDSMDYIYEILKEHKGLTGVIHSVNGDLKVVNKIIELGYVVSFNGIMTFKNAQNIAELASDIDIKNIILETDSPFLSPVPVRGEKNTPENVKYVYEYLADLKELPISKVKKIIRNNIERVFQLPGM